MGNIDFEIPEDKNVTIDAKITADYPKYAGMDRYEARKEIVKDYMATKYDYDLGKWVGDPDAPGFQEYTMDMFYEDKNILAAKTGVDIFNLAKDEVIISEYLIKGEIANYQAAIDAGLTVRMSTDWEGKDVIKTFKVVGI